MLDYNQALDYILTKLPMYQKVGISALKKKLDNITFLCALLDNPHKKIQTIHIAGTNGKGSVTHYLASILQSAGYKIGCYTSPHYIDFRERIKINGQFISKVDIVNFVQTYQHQIESIQPSFFEISVAMAFWYFEKKHVDIAIIETGLGGRLDSTNIIHPLLSIITNISLDHQHILGNTLKEIAIEKAGIIKEKTPVIIGEKQIDTTSIFKQIALQKKAPIYWTSDIKVKGWSLFLPSYIIKGSYLSKNIYTAIHASQYLLSTNDWHISNMHIKKGIKKVYQTYFIGRWQCIQNIPLTIIDGAHNIAGIKEILYNISQLAYEELHIVYGVVKEKKINPILDILPKKAHYYFTQAEVSRAMPAKELKAQANTYGLNGNAYTKTSQAYKEMQTKARANDLCLVIGSIFIVGEILSNVHLSK